MGQHAEGAPTVSDFGFNCRDDHSRLTYRVVDVAVSLCFHAAILAIPVVLPLLPLPSAARPASRRAPGIRAALSH